MSNEKAHNNVLSIHLIFSNQCNTFKLDFHNDYSKKLGILNKINKVNNNPMFRRINNIRSITVVQFYVKKRTR